MSQGGVKTDIRIAVNKKQKNKIAKDRGNQALNFPFQMKCHQIFQTKKYFKKIYCCNQCFRQNINLHIVCSSYRHDIFPESFFSAAG